MNLQFSLKGIFRNAPLMNRLPSYLRRRKGGFRSSSEYWEQRYRNGGNSGPGSYDRLAEFKADFLNAFVERHQITSVVEYGCGDGAQLKLARYPDYTGVDISPKAVEMCRSLFSGDSSKHFLKLDADGPTATGDLCLSLDVVFHLVEDNVFHAYMQRLFESARRFVIIYSSNIDQEWPDKHVRHRQFTRWVEQNIPDWYLQSTCKNAYPYDHENPTQTSFSDFYVFAQR